MIYPIKVNKVIKNWERSGFEIVQKHEIIDALWGLEHRKITDDDIKALKEGKYLYCDDGEYAQIISYEKSEGKDAELDIIKCKDCKHFEAWRHNPEVIEKYGQLYNCSLLILTCPSPNDYCSKAERKETEEE